MNRKAIGIAVVFLVLLAVGYVFAQECLSNSAARVSASGRSVTVKNNMTSDSINVEIFYTGVKYNTLEGTGKGYSEGTGPSGSIETGAISPLGSKSITLPEGTKYTSYTVWACR